MAEMDKNLGDNRGRDAYRPVTKDLKEAWRISRAQIFPSIGKYMLLGLLSGAILIIFGSYLHPLPDGRVLDATHLLGVLIRELGLALVVSAIAIYGYELVGHVTGFLERERDFTDHIRILDDASLELRRAAGDWRYALKGDMVRLFDNESLADNLLKTIQFAVNISRRNHAHRQAYLAFIGRIVDMSVNEIVGALERLQEHIVTRQAFREEIYHVPESRAIAGQTLTLLLDCLGQGDRYRSVSNILFYQRDLMNTLLKAAGTACQRGVTIRRIFDVADFEEHIPVGDDFTKCKLIIKEHYKLAADLKAKSGKDEPCYEIGFAGRELWSWARREIAYLPAAHEHLVNRRPFGLFCHEHEKNGFLFIAHEGERASKVGLAYWDENDRTQAFFDKLWEKASQAHNPFAGDSFNMKP